MTHDTSRKSFLAKVLGLATVGALAPRKAAGAAIAKAGLGTGEKTAAFRLQPQARAVARRDGTA